MLLFGIFHLGEGGGEDTWLKSHHRDALCHNAIFDGSIWLYIITWSFSCQDSVSFVHTNHKMYLYTVTITWHYVTPALLITGCELLSYYGIAPIIKFLEAKKQLTKQYDFYNSKAVQTAQTERSLGKNSYNTKLLVHRSIHMIVDSSN